MNIIITATGPQLSSFSIMIIIFIIINIIVIVIFSDAGLYKCRVDFYRAPTQISEVALSVIGDQSSRSPSPKKICEEVFSLLMFGVESQFGQIWQLSAWTLLVKREMVQAYLKFCYIVLVVKQWEIFTIWIIAIYNPSNWMEKSAKNCPQSAADMGRLKLIVQLDICPFVPVIKK